MNDKIITIYVAHYIAKGDVYDKLIRGWQWLAPFDRLLHMFNKRLPTYKHYKTSHSEIVFKDDNGDYQFASSSGRDGGVRIKHVIPNTGNWEFTPIQITETQFFLLTVFYKRHVGKKYDNLGIALSQILPLGISKQQKFFCSEFCATGLDFAGIIEFDKHFDWYSPARLRTYLRIKTKVDILP